MAAAAEESFSFLRAGADMPPDFTLNGMPIQRDGQLVITPTVARILLWDLNQCHTHSELTIVDRVVCPTAASDPAHTRLVSSVFARSRQFPTLPPTEVQADLGGPMQYREVEGCTQADNELREMRLICWRNFRKVLQAWPGASEFKYIVEDIDWANADQCNEMEFQCCSFYCRTFFSTFGRAPTVPRYLPECWRYVIV